MSRRNPFSPAVENPKIVGETKRYYPTASQLPYGTRGIFVSTVLLPRYLPPYQQGLQYRIKLESQPQRRHPNRIKGYGTKF